MSKVVLVVNLLIAPSPCLKKMEAYGAWGPLSKVSCIRTLVRTRGEGETASECPQPAGVGAGQRWVVGQDLDNKSVSVQLLSNVCPMIVQTLSMYRVCPNPVQMLSSSCPLQLVLSRYCHVSVRLLSTETVIGHYVDEYIQSLSGYCPTIYFLKTQFFILDKQWTTI